MNKEDTYLLAQWWKRGALPADPEENQRVRKLIGTTSPEELYAIKRGATKLVQNWSKSATNPRK